MDLLLFSGASVNSDDDAYSPLIIATMGVVWNL